MEAPVPPTLREFDLDEGAMARLPKLRFAGDKLDSWGMIGGTLIVVALLIVYRPSLLLVPAVVVGGWVGGLIFLLGLHSILGWGEKKLLRWRNEDFRKACAYQAARATYSIKKAEFDAWSRKRQEDYWRALSGAAFEVELGRLFSAMGYDVSLTPRSGDGGVDLCLRKDGKLTVVQCKAHNKRVPIGVARELCASMTDFHANDAIIACFEGVTQPVAEYIKNRPITVL